MDIGDLRKVGVSTRGDLGVACLGYALGAAVDAFFFPGGLPTTSVAMFAAIGALGVKNSVQAMARALAQHPRDAKKMLLGRAHQVLKASNSAKARQLKKAIPHWESGQMDDGDFVKLLEDAEGGR